MTGYLITTAAVPHRCGRCGSWTLAGHAEGVLVRIDPLPLDERAELAALLDSRATYDVHTELFRSRIFLKQRSSIEISAPRRWPVVTDHRCGQPSSTTPPPLPPPPLRPPLRPHPPNDHIDDDPPF